MADTKVFFRCEKFRILRSRAEKSFYYTFAKSEKRYKAVDVDGLRYQLNLETGELRAYNKTEIINTVKRSVKYSRQRLQDILDMNVFDWFLTLTFSDFAVDRFDDNAVESACKRFLENMRKRCPRFYYVCVPERHTSGCLHFHLLVGGVRVRELGLTDSGKVCCSWATKKNNICSKEYFESTKKGRILTPTDGLTVYNVSKFCYGFSTATKIVSKERCNWYLSKYVDKNFGSTDMWCKRYRWSKNLDKPFEETKAELVGRYESSAEIARQDRTINFANKQFNNNTYNVSRLFFNKEQFEMMNKVLLSGEPEEVSGALPFDIDDEYEYKER